MGQVVLSNKHLSLVEIDAYSAEGRYTPLLDFAFTEDAADFFFAQQHIVGPFDAGSGSQAAGGGQASQKGQ